MVTGMKSYAGKEEEARIFDVALALMEEIGYEKTTIRRICTEANISIGKFYHYFSSKQELLRFFYDQAEKDYADQCRDSLMGKDIKVQIVDFYTWYGAYLEEYGVEFVTNFFSNQNPAMNTHIYNNPIIAITDELLYRAVQAGYAAPGPGSIHDLSCDLCVIVKGAIFDWCVRHGEFSLKDAVRLLLERCIAGIM